MTWDFRQAASNKTFAINGIGIAPR